MCYLVAKRFDKAGSIAVKTCHGKELVNFAKSLRAEISEKNIQLVTISSPDAYKEYAPYQMVSTKSEFVNGIMTL